MWRHCIACLACLLLAACGGGPVGNPQPLAPAQVQPPWIEGPDGTRLALSVWPSRAEERAIILALHGYGDFAPSTYQWAAEDWAQRGITTYAYDQRGFGRNSSAKAWPGPRTLSRDLVAVTREVRARHPGVPLTVVGHSMGGGVTLTAAANGLDADAIVLAGPAIAGGSGVNLAQRFGAWTIATFATDRRFTGKGVVRITPTDNIEIRRQVTSSPWHFADPSGRELMGLIRVMDAAAAAAPSVTLPTLTLMGANDQILRPQAVKAVHDRIPGPKQYVLYPDGWHWLFRDYQAPRVWADVAEFALSQ